jgi:hypothetical protein
MSSPKSGRNRFALTAVLLLTAGSAGAQENLDQGKSAPKLFAETCATCHRSARGLAKGRFSISLYLFLQKHYASNSSSAWALTSYLESVESAKRPEKRAAAAHSPPSSTWTARSSLRPPMPVPGR